MGFLFTSVLIIACILFFGTLMIKPTDEELQATAKLRINSKEQNVICKINSCNNELKIYDLDGYQISPQEDKISVINNPILTPLPLTAHRKRH